MKKPLRLCINSLWCACHLFSCLAYPGRVFEGRAIAEVSWAASLKERFFIRKNDNKIDEKIILDFGFCILYAVIRGCSYCNLRKRRCWICGQGWPLSPDGGNPSGAYITHNL